MILPIAARELIVAARRKSTYRSRFLAVMGAVAVLVWQIAEAQGVHSSLRGANLFRSLAFLIWIFCLSIGTWLTSDCISEERREGTLGLLFLTKLKGRDVTIGKLVARSVTAFYSVVALLPVLTVPILMGGVQMGEIWKSGLAIVLTMILSVSAGIFVSSVNQVERKAIFYTVLLLLALLFGPMFLAAYLDDSLNLIDAEDVWKFIFPSPGFTIGLSLQVWNLWPQWTLWLGYGALVVTSLLLLGLANIFVTRRWADTALEPKMEVKIPVAKPVESKRIQRPARRLLDQNPYLWLAYRNPEKSRNVWVFTGFMLFFWGAAFLMHGKWAYDLEVVSMIALVVNGFLKFWIISETCTRISEDKKSGAFELLLATPLKPISIIAGVGLSIAQQFWRPVLLLLLLESIPLFLHMNGGRWGDNYLSRSTDYHYARLFGSVLLMLADSVAIFLLGLWLAIRCKTYTIAVVVTSIIILLTPWVFLWAMPFSNRYDHALFLLFMGLVVDFGATLWAWLKLHQNFRKDLTEVRH